MKDKPYLYSDGPEEWFVRMGNKLFSDKWRYDNISVIALLLPISVWILFSIVLHQIGAREAVHPWLIYIILFLPFFVNIPILAVARRMSDKLFGDYYSERKQEWNSKSTSQLYQEAIDELDLERARKIVTYQLLTTIGIFLIGWIAGAGAFYIFVY